MQGTGAWQCMGEKKTPERCLWIVFSSEQVIA